MTSKSHISQRASALSNGKIRGRVEQISPEIALRWLERSTTNRKVNQRRVEEFARDMASDSWLLTGQPIIFGPGGELLDGQHRLWACVTACVPFESYVIRGVAPETRIAMDTGAKRTLGNYLTMLGEQNANALGAAINLCWRYEHHRLAAVENPTHEEALDWLAENPELRESLNLATKVRVLGIPFTPTASASAHYLNSRVDSDAATLFWESMGTGENLTVGDPILALRRWVMTAASARDRIRTDHVFAVYMKAMNLWRSQKSVRLLTWKSHEPMPEPWS